MEPHGGKYLTFLLDKENYGIPIKILSREELAHLKQELAEVK